jgi:hypothetical protein
MRRRTPIREGPEADAMARWLRIASILLAAIALSIPPLFWGIAASLTPE